MEPLFSQDGPVQAVRAVYGLSRTVTGTASLSILLVHTVRGQLSLAAPPPYRAGRAGCHFDQGLSHGKMAVVPEALRRMSRR